MAQKTISRPRLWTIRWSVSRVVLIEILVFVILLLTANIFKLALPFVVVVAVGAFLLGVVLFCVVFKYHTIFEWFALWFSYARRKNEDLTYPKPYHSTEHNGIGALIHDDSYLSVIELFSPMRTPVFVERGIAEYSLSALVPVDALIDALYQYDVTLGSIDIVNVGAKQVPNSSYDQIYSQLVPDSPAVGKRRTFIVVRLKPQDLLAPVIRRGGGGTGMSKTLNIVTQRTIRLLRAEGIQAKTLKRSEILETIPELYEKFQPQKISASQEISIKERWSYIDINSRSVATTFAIDPKAWSVENQNAWWRATTLRTAQVIRISPAGEDVRDGAKVRGWIQYITQDKLPTAIVETSGLRLLHGRQAKAGNLPIFHLSPTSNLDTASLHVYQGDDRFAIPIGASGQYFGRTLNNKHVYLDLFATGGQHLAPRLIFKNIDTRFIMQIALRALSIGAKVKIHSPSWRVWRALINETRSNNIWIEDDANRTNADLVIYDRAIARGESPSRTLLSIDTDDHFPKNVSITITAPDYNDPELLHVDLGDRIGIIRWSSSKAESQYTGDVQEYPQYY